MLSLLIFFLNFSLFVKINLSFPRKKCTKEKCCNLFNVTNNLKCGFLYDSYIIFSCCLQ